MCKMHFFSWDQEEKTIQTDDGKFRKCLKAYRQLFQFGIDAQITADMFVPFVGSRLQGIRVK